MNDPTRQRPEPPLRGLVAGKYEIVGLIGRGGMGSVWEGRHASLGTSVAIKFIDQEYVGSREAQARFAIEARAAAAIQSKYAVQIFDHGTTDSGRPYIVMELLVGEPLDRRLERRGRISLRETARSLGQVCRALQRAHDAGIIHRDLKPENIFMVQSPDDDDEIAKVLDFGIAKIKAPPGDARVSSVTSSTKTGAVLGTPYYMAPEQVRGLRSIDHRADLWSVGVIVYKCVTGALPFDGESVGDLLVKICTAPLPVPSAIVAGLPAAFDAWFRRALEREPAMRYASASELAEALLHAAGMSTRRGADAGAEPTPPTPTVRPTVAMRPLTPAPTSPAIAGTPTPVTATSGRALGSESSRPSRPAAAIWLAVLAAAVVGGSVGVFLVVKLMSPPSDASAATSRAASQSRVVETAGARQATSLTPIAEASGPDSSSATPPPLSPAVAPVARPTHPQGLPGAKAPGPYSSPARPTGAGGAVKSPPASADPGY
jgi:eukaryotic-like serine/threonine-protein kinase